MSRISLEARASCLQRLYGVRVNLFRAMHDRSLHIADDLTVVASRSGDYALTLCVTFDPVFAYYYVRDCGWYGCDLSRLSDEDVPENVQRELLTQFSAILG